jgi:hypothetical protein
MSILKEGDTIISWMGVCGECFFEIIYMSIFKEGDTRISRMGVL